MGSEVRSCVKVEVAVLLGSGPNVDVKQLERTEFRSCVKVEVAVLVSPSLTVVTVSACGHKATLKLSLLLLVLVLFLLLLLLPDSV